MFKFKQFTIHQDRTAMKVGTDGVLLGAWAPILSSTHRLLDIGTGTGLIALMLAQRILKENNNSTFKIDAIDIDQSSIEQATENINNSPFAKFITTHFTALQNYSPTEKYDTIVCNPPYFVASLKCPDANRTQHSSRLLNDEGTLSVILPVNEGNQLIQLASQYGFSLAKLVHIHPTPTSDPKRLLMHFTKQPINSLQSPIEESQLTIELARHQYTPEYTALTRDFYLKM